MLKPQEWIIAGKVERCPTACAFTLVEHSDPRLPNTTTSVGQIEGRVSRS